MLTFAVAAKIGTPWVPTTSKQREFIIDEIKLNDDDIVYDLGCGDGSVLFALNRKNKNIKAVGVEISLLPYFLAKVKKLFTGELYKTVEIKYKNLFKQDLSDADVVFVYSLKKAYPRLISKFKQELKDDCLVVIEVWPFDDIREFKKIKKEKLLATYFYRGCQFRDEKFIDDRSIDGGKNYG